MSRNTKGLATQLPYQTSASELSIAIPRSIAQVSLLRVTTAVGSEEAREMDSHLSRKRVIKDIDS